MEKLYTLREAAQVARMSDRTLRKRIQDGQLRALRPGNKILISESDLQQFLDSTATTVRDSAGIAGSDCSRG